MKGKRRNPILPRVLRRRDRAEHGGLPCRVVPAQDAVDPAQVDGQNGRGHGTPPGPLDLAYTSVDDTAMPVLMGFPKLTSLSLEETKVTERAQEELRRAHPRLDFTGW